MRICMIGVGLMGHGIAKNILRAGSYHLSFLHHDGNQPIDDLLAAGAIQSETMSMIFIVFKGPHTLLPVCSRDWLHDGFVIIFLTFFLHRFSPPPAPILEPTWPQLGLQNRAKVGPRAIQNPFKIVYHF